MAKKRQNMHEQMLQQKGEMKAALMQGISKPQAMQSVEKPTKAPKIKVKR